MTDKKATLVIMAAGIGSRFGGGIKQLEPVGPGGEIIVDYSIIDAIQAGFDKVVFVIRKELEADFREVIGRRIEEKVEVAYTYQEVWDLPGDYATTFMGRTKPWGTGQAILACRGLVQEPFVVINADDYYGKSAYSSAYDYLTKQRVEEGGCHEAPLEEIPEIAMVSFILKNTLSDFGTVTRGICEKNDQGDLVSIVETSGIAKRGSGAVVLEENQEKPIDLESLVSMNMWCFFPDFFQKLEAGFETFLKGLANDKAQGGSAYQKAEYLLPTLVGHLLEQGELKVKVLESKDQWFGVTYKEDKERVVSEIQKLIERGVYS